MACGGREVTTICQSITILMTNESFQLFLNTKMQNIAGLSFFSVVICCFCSSFVRIYRVLV